MTVRGSQTVGVLPPLAAGKKGWGMGKGVKRTSLHSTSQEEAVEGVDNV